jgi:hypothetical protein
MCRLADHRRSAARFRQEEGCLAYGHRAGGRKRLSPGQSGDKRGDIFVYALRIGKSMVRHLASVSCGLGPVTGGVVFSKLSKLLNHEDALSVPC